LLPELRFGLVERERFIDLFLDAAAQRSKDTPHPLASFSMRQKHGRLGVSRRFAREVEARTVGREQRSDPERAIAQVGFDGAFGDARDAYLIEMNAIAKLAQIAM
jgi:hypothetical protein